MKKLYRKGTVHPSPPPPQQPSVTDPLAFLPAAILALAAALTTEDREVLAYLLLSCSSASSPPTFPTSNLNHQSPNKKKGIKGAGTDGDHPPAFSCNCFRCYLSYWVRWDSSPNRQLIHEIIDAFEDWILANNRGSNNNNNKGGRRERKKKPTISRDLPEIDRVSEMGFAREDLGMPESAEPGGERGGEGEGSGGSSGGELEEKGSVRKLVSFIGERIWSVWG